MTVRPNKFSIVPGAPVLVDGNPTTGWGPADHPPSAVSKVWRICQGEAVTEDNSRLDQDLGRLSAFMHRHLFQTVFRKVADAQTGAATAPAANKHRYP